MPTPPTRVGYYAPATGNYSSATTPKTTPAFNVVAGDIIVLQVSGENAGNLLATLPTPTASGGSVVWTLRAKQPTTNSASISFALCWTGVVGATATGITVSLARPISDTSPWWGLSATLWRDHGGVGVVFQNNNGTASSAPSVAATCSANSAVQCVVNDWNAADGASRVWRTINGTPMSESLYYIDTTRHTVYGGYRLDTGAAGSVTMGLTSPATQRWALAGVEILGAATAAPIQHGWGIAA